MLAPEHRVPSPERAPCPTRALAAALGLPWLVDPELRTIEAMRNVEGAWEVLARLDDDHPTAEIELAGVAVPLDLRQILRD